MMTWLGRPHAIESGTAMWRADMVLLENGQPVVLVEAKRRVVPDLRDAALEQLRSYAQRLGNRWTLLIEPEKTAIYQGAHVDKPFAELPTREILEQTELGDARHI